MFGGHQYKRKSKKGRHRIGNKGQGRRTSRSTTSHTKHRMRHNKSRRNRKGHKSRARGRVGHKKSHTHRS